VQMTRHPKAATRGLFLYNLDAYDRLIDH
jgi:hypothetical protein